MPRIVILLDLGDILHASPIPVLMLALKLDKFVGDLTLQGGFRQEIDLLIRCARLFIVKQPAET